MRADHFSAVAEKYAAYRPSYPPALAEFLADLAPARDLAWDCATGSGQAAVLLAERFSRVVATDLSEQQIRHAQAHRRVGYLVAAERAAPLADRSCDLVSVAQAAHWLDLDAFYREVSRVLKPDGVIAIWGYARIHVAPDVDPHVTWFEYDRVGPYWPGGRKHVNAAYRTLAFPFARVEAPAFVMERSWSRTQFLNYIGTWSAVGLARKAEGRDPLPELAMRLEAVWPDDTLRQVRWPIHLLLGRNGVAPASKDSPS